MVIPPNLDEEFALIYGVLLGDGCLSRCGKGRFISIVGNKKDDLEFFKILCEILTWLRNKKTVYRIRNKQRKVEINFSDKNLFDEFKDKGFKVGKKGNKIRFPPIIDKKFWKYIIQGYFATDGSLVICNNNGTIYPRIEFQSISKPLLEDVRSYLREYGLTSGLYISKRYNDTNHQTLYRIQYNGKIALNTFKESLGFINPKHIQKYKNAGGGI